MCFFLPLGHAWFIATNNQAPTHRFFPGFCRVSGCDFEIDPDSLIPGPETLYPSGCGGKRVEREMLESLTGEGKIHQTMYIYIYSCTCFLLWLLHLTVTGRDWYMIFICVGAILCWQEGRWSHTLQYKVSSQRLAVVTLPWGRFAWSANWRLFDVTCLAHPSSGFTASNQQKIVTFILLVS